MTVRYFVSCKRKSFGFVAQWIYQGSADPILNRASLVVKTACDELVKEHNAKVESPTDSYLDWSSRGPAVIECRHIRRKGGVRVEIQSYEPGPFTSLRSHNFLTEFTQLLTHCYRTVAKESRLNLKSGVRNASTAYHREVSKMDVVVVAKELAPLSAIPESVLKAAHETRKQLNLQQKPSAESTESSDT